MDSFCSPGWIFLLVWCLIQFLKKQIWIRCFLFFLHGLTLSIRTKFKKSFIVEQEKSEIFFFCDQKRRQNKKRNIISTQKPPLSPNHYCSKDNHYFGLKIVLPLFKFTYFYVNGDIQILFFSFYSTLKFML